MKLLDPFAGYRLASGHPIFHLSLFISSFNCEKFGTTTNVDGIEFSFFILRWAHCLQFSLALVSILTKTDTYIKEFETNLKATQEQIEEEKLRNLHRDSMWKLLGRFCDTISVFAY